MNNHNLRFLFCLLAGHQIKSPKSKQDEIK